jgi:hypothetical protein
MRGVVLAGGTGSRLNPLTIVTNKRPLQSIGSDGTLQGLTFASCCRCASQQASGLWQRIETSLPNVFDIWPVIHRDARGIWQLAPVDSACLPLLSQVAEDYGFENAPSRARNPRTISVRRPVK